MSTETRTTPRGLVHSRRAAVLMLLGFLATEMPPPYQAVALVALLPALFESVRALRLFASEHAPRSATLWSAIGLVLVAALSAIVERSTVAYALGGDYRDCMRGANTQTAAGQCKERGGAGVLSDFLLNG